MSSLPSGFDERIRILKTVLDEVFTKTIDEWVNGFECDRNPEKELLVWECIALTYNTFVESRALPLDSKKEAIGILLLYSTGVPEKKLLKSKHKFLPVAAVQSLLTLYKASAGATIAVNHGRQTSH